MQTFPFHLLDVLGVRYSKGRDAKLDSSITQGMRIRFFRPIRASLCLAKP